MSFPAFPLAMARGLGLVDGGVIAIYLLAMIVVGLYFSRGQTSNEEYLLGKRNMSPLLVGISLVATLVSTISYLATPGDMIQHGVAFATTVLAVPLWLTVILYVWVPFFMRYRFTSIYEYVELRFNRAARSLAAGLFILMRLGWMGLIIYTAGRAVAQMTANAPAALADRFGAHISPEQWLYLIMIVMGLTTTAYTYLGGIRAVIWTDFAQFTVMTAGVLFTIGYIWSTTGAGPVRWWHDAAQHRHGMLTWFSSDLTVERTAFLVILDTFFWKICTHCSDQVATQRYFSTRGTKEALRSNVIAALADFLLIGLLGVLGLALVSFYSSPERASAVFGGTFDPLNADHAAQAFPRFVVDCLPIGMAGLVVAALLSAAMSSISSGINSVSAVVVTDFRRRANSTAAGGRETSRAREYSLITGGAITGIAFLIALVIAADPRNRNIIDLSQKVFNLFLGPLGGLFIAGVFFPFVGSAAAIVATIFGVALAIVVCFAKEMFRLPHGAPVLLVTPTTTVATVLAAVLLGSIFPRPDRRRIDGHTWWTRHKIRPPTAGE
jgi:solute:Na+ symporter, SSS family